VAVNLHPDNRHVKDKIRQQFPNTGVMWLPLHVDRGIWRLQQNFVTEAESASVREMTWNVPFDFTSTPKPSYMLSEESLGWISSFNFCIEL